MIHVLDVIGSMYFTDEVELLRGRLARPLQRLVEVEPRDDAKPGVERTLVNAIFSSDLDIQSFAGDRNAITISMLGSVVTGAARLTSEDHGQVVSLLSSLHGNDFKELDARMATNDEWVALYNDVCEAAKVSHAHLQGFISNENARLHIVEKDLEEKMIKEARQTAIFAARVQD